MVPLKFSSKQFFHVNITLNVLVYWLLMKKYVFANLNELITSPGYDKQSYGNTSIHNYEN